MANNDQNNNKNSYNKDRVLVDRNVFYVSKGNQKIVFVSVDSLIGLAHDLEVG